VAARHVPGKGRLSLPATVDLDRWSSTTELGLWLAHNMILLHRYTPVFLFLLLLLLH